MPGVLGLEQFELGHVRGASAGSQPDHPPVVPPPDYVRLAKRAYESWAVVEAEAGRTDRHGHRRPGPVAGRPGHPDGRLHREPHRRRRPVRAPGRRRDPATLAAVAPRRRRDRHVPGAGRPGRPEPGQRRAPAARAGANGATLLDRTPVLAIRDAGGGELEVETHGRRPPDRRASSWRPTPGRTGSWRASIAQLPLTVTKEQVTYFACPRPGRLRPRPLPGLDLDGRPVASTASRPTARPARRRPRTAAACRWTRTPGRSTGTRPPSSASTSFMAAHLPGALGPAHLHEDVPVHADPGSRLRARPAARPSRRRRGARGRSRVQVRIGARSRRGRAQRRRRDARRPANWRPSGSIGRSCSRRTRRTRGWYRGPHRTDPCT